MQLLLYGLSINHDDDAYSIRFEIIPIQYSQSPVSPGFLLSSVVLHP